MASLSSSMGMTKEAEEYYCDALQINQQFYSEEHPIFMNNQMLLATLWGALGRHRESLPILGKNYALQLKFRNGTYPDIISGQGNLGLTYYYNGQLYQSEKIMLDLLPKIK
ncbi:MAG: tetratricopeptide (TPR) repeat protein [Arenicella sp.]|jgi:tetratricopeptide (TPR) repeat protein